MLNDLEYMRVYDLGGDKGGYKGVYLGQYGPQSKHAFQHLILVNKVICPLINKFEPTNQDSLWRFSEYSLDTDARLVLNRVISVDIPGFQKKFYKDILEKKLINPPKEASTQSL